MTVLTLRTCTGRIPSEIGLHTALTELTLESNELTGALQPACACVRASVVTRAVISDDHLALQPSQQ